MIKDAIQALAEMAVRAQTPIVVPPGEPPGVYMVRNSTGDYVRHEAGAQPENLLAYDLDSLVAKIKDWRETGYMAEVWVSQYGVVGIADPTLLDRITLPLAFTPQFRKIVELRSRNVFDQKGLLKLLRVDLHGSASISLIDTVRSVKFRQNQAADAEIKQGKVSIGKSLQAELVGADAIPETMILRIPVFDSVAHPFDTAVLCDLEVDPASERFLVQTLPLEDVRAIQAAEAHLVGLATKLLGESKHKIPVYHGYPDGEES